MLLATPGEKVRGGVPRGRARFPGARLPQREGAGTLTERSKDSATGLTSTEYRGSG